MIPSVVALFNLALNAVGTRDDVSSVDERSREAEVCRLWYPQARDTVLQAAYWASTKGFARLAVLAERTTDTWSSTDPEPGFRFAYALPSDFIQPRYLSSYERFTMGLMLQGGGDVRALMASTEQAVLCYTKRQDNPTLWDGQLGLAIAYSLAAHIGMPLHAKAQRVNNAIQIANQKIMEARVSAANSEVNSYETIPDWIAARGYAGSAPDARYYFPMGPSLSIEMLPGV
jgi:hypothetical protein